MKTKHSAKNIKRSIKSKQRIERITLLLKMTIKVNNSI